MIPLKLFLALTLFTVDLPDESKAQQQIQTKQTLDSRQQSIIVISAFTANGDLVQLQSALNTGLDAGLTVNEIKEIMIHLYAYCGFPRSIRGLQTLMKVLEERKAKGINDQSGPEAAPVTDERSKYERGVETLYELTGSDWSNPKSGYSAFAPAIDTFLKEHLFADIFERNVLTYQQRELVTISALSSIGGVEPMLRSHFNICLNIGLTHDQLNQFVHIIESKVGVEEGNAAQTILNEIK